MRTDGEEGRGGTDNGKQQTEGSAGPWKQKLVIIYNHISSVPFQSINNICTLIGSDKIYQQQSYS
jgi:hypothetical protein